MIRVKLIGATGYGGLGMIECLQRHPAATLVGVIATQEIGTPISKIWSYLAGYCDLPILAPDSPEARDLEADITILATPDGVGQTLVPAEYAAGRKVIDYSGDFRFNQADLYADYARRIGREPEHRAAELLGESVYGVTELHREAIRKARIVGNPGCFAIASILGLAPAAREGLIEPEGIVCDCKSGVSGAGKTPKPAFHYPEQYENTFAYRLQGHQHVMEIERELSRLANASWRVTFTPQVVPMARGILASLYGRLPTGMNQTRVLAAYQDFYADSPFVRVAETCTGTAEVRGSNRCVITVACDERTNTFRVVSHIDNLMKGQAGSALQNLNVMCGLEETLGLDGPGSHP